MPRIKCSVVRDFLTELTSVRRTLESMERDRSTDVRDIDDVKKEIQRKEAQLQLLVFLYGLDLEKTPNNEEKLRRLVST